MNEHMKSSTCMFWALIPKWYCKIPKTLGQGKECENGGSMN
jgi:hypothetical protein